MNLTGVSVKKPVTILMITFIVIILGAVSLTRLPIDLLPKIEVPIIVVSTSYSGVGPQEIEKLITRPIEGAAATVTNIKNITSSSSEGNSMVMIEFNYGTDMNFAALEVREKVDAIKGRLPSGVSSPMVIKIDPNAQAIMNISIYNKDDLAKLQATAEDFIQPRFEKIEGVASVSLAGGYRNQVEVKVNEQKSKGYGLTIDYISQILASENLNSPGGVVDKGNQELTIRTMGEFKTVADIKMLPIPIQQTGGIVYLKDIADVKISHKNVTSIVKTNGSDSISISIQKQSGSNTVQVADRVNKELELLKKDFPNVNFTVTNDTSKFIKSSISNVASSAYGGAALAILILYMFLRNIRTTFVIGTSIPISIIATFTLIYFNGITLNLMTLGGLALGVGMLVDNSIVVLENIYRFREEGHSRIDAAIKGTAEVSMAVTASTLTTIAVFLPIVFVQGMTAAIFKELALTVTFSLAASLVVSLTLVPMMAARLLRTSSMGGERNESRIKLFSKLYDAFDTGFARVESGYKKLLNSALNRRWRTVLITFVIFVASMASVATVGAEYFPQSDEGRININITLPDGAELVDTSKVVTDIEGRLKNIPEIDRVSSRAGSGGGFGGRGGGTNGGSVTVILKELKDRKRSSSQVADQIRGLTKDIAGVRIGVNVSSSSMGMGGGEAVTISVRGDDIDTLKKITDDFKTIVESVQGTRDVRTGLSDGVPEVIIKIDRKSASQYGITAAQIASAVNSTMSGKTATRYKYNSEELDVIVKGDDSYRESISNLKNIFISTPSGSIPLGQVADIAIEIGPRTISRDAQVRTVSVTSQIMGRDLASITNDIQIKLAEYNMPYGYTYKFGGQRQQQTEAFADLALALILACVLVYMIIAAQFESLIHPLTIMMSVPLSFAGGALGLFITRRTLNVTSLIGAIMLAGIVVNNAIVLVDYINTRRSFGEERREAILNAGPIRLRPILMTTLTTVLGLIPLALGIGDGGETQAPMATVVIFGLSLSTLLTLVIIPVIYTLLDDFANFMKTKLFNRKKTIKIEGTSSSM